MKREIKFRGKRVDNNEWVYGYLVISETSFNKNQHCIIELKNHFQTSSTPSGNLCFSETDSRVHVVIPETVGQYTGLKDEEGKEIYEGDIFKYLLPDIKSEEEPETFTEYIEAVTYEDGGLTLEVMPLFAACKEGKVIGTIHENPELIK